ncbi:hypothetical protein DRQ29_00330 [bacterium]|nr:MAG: hypothetical protein DRQ29_00330 [bacterium]
MSVEKKEQKIKAMGLFPEELQLEPEFVRELSLNNKFQRTLPLLTGWTGNRQVLLRATTGGLLKVSTVTEIYERYEVNPSSGTGGYITVLGGETKIETFSEVMSKVDIACKDNSIYIELSNDGVTYGGKIQLDAGDVFSEQISVKAVRITNVTTDGTADGKYQVIGYK